VQEHEGLTDLRAAVVRGATERLSRHHDRAGSGAMPNDILYVSARVVVATDDAPVGPCGGNRQRSGCFACRRRAVRSNVLTIGSGIWSNVRQGRPPYLPRVHGQAQLSATADSIPPRVPGVVDLDLFGTADSRSLTTPE